ncbi:MAG: DUF445 family protein [Actinobacteria bacterium]|nr:DUF445 family protein [Actinomycetota bacterium]MCB9389340.1 DUF445 family protein [Acidimicrobiia bacterium]
MDHALLILITVPLVTAFIGWSTNWAGVKMIFYPQKFVGIPPILGWQGVLPRKASKFAADVGDMMTDNILDAEELVSKIDPDEVEALFGETIDEQAENIVTKVAAIMRPGYWDQLDPSVQTMIIDMIKNQTRDQSRALFDDMKDRSNEVIDLKELIIGLLTGPNVDRLVRLFQEISAKEMKFIIRSGAYLGLIIGIVQAFVVLVADDWWLPPIIGIGVGLLTNFVAIQMIFRPIEPKRYFGLFTYQGLFPKRQDEISRQYGEIAANEIITPENLIEYLTRGETGNRISAQVLETVSGQIDQNMPLLEQMFQVEASPEQVQAVKVAVLSTLLSAIPEVQPDLEKYLAKRLDVEETVYGKLSSLPKPEFERILRGVLEEDEWILVAIGGVLGGLVGLVQGLVILGT